MYVGNTCFLKKMLNNKELIPSPVEFSARYVMRNRDTRRFFRGAFCAGYDLDHLLLRHPYVFEMLTHVFLMVYDSILFRGAFDLDTVLKIKNTYPHLKIIAQNTPVDSELMKICDGYMFDLTDANLVDVTGLYNYHEVIPPKVTILKQRGKEVWMQPRHLVENGSVSDIQECINSADYILITAGRYNGKTENGHFPTIPWFMNFEQLKIDIGLWDNSKILLYIPPTGLLEIRNANIFLPVSNAHLDCLNSFHSVTVNYKKGHHLGLIPPNTLETFAKCFTYNDPIMINKIVELVISKNLAGLVMGSILDAGYDREDTQFFNSLAELSYYERI